MLYKIDKNITEVKLCDYAKENLFIGYYKEAEFKQYNEDCFHFSKEVFQQIHHYQKAPSKISKIDAYPDYYIGEIVLLNKDKTKYTQTLYFLIRKNLLLILHEDEHLLNYFHTAILAHDIAITSLERLVFLFLDILIQNDNLLLDHIQQTLSEIDEKVFKNVSMNFNQAIELSRKQIILLDHNYEHLLEIGEELVDNELEFFDADTRYFKILKDRFSRLHNTVHVLQEFMKNIQESHQSNIDNDLNKTMKILTVITAIFQPLTLIVGWYGMNFYNMPEIAWRYGYVFVILLSISSILACYWIFKKKKFL